jgi:hypothetical protein
MGDGTPRRQRDLRLDFFRGLALFFIFIDHIPDNTLSYATLAAVGFSDAAEVFIFISGYTAAMVYGRAMDQQGALFGAAQIFRRVWTLYVAHIFLFVIFTAEVSYTVLTFNNPMYNDELRVGDFLAEPHVAIIKALLLQFQPPFLDILPLYIVLLGAFPAVLLLLRVHPALALVPSLLLYLAVTRFHIYMRAYPEGNAWFFNPFAWQLLFIIGGALGYAAQQGRRILPASPRLMAVAAAFVVFAFVVKMSWAIHSVYDPFPALLIKQLWPINKNNLAPIRLIHFLSLAYVVVYFVRADAVFLQHRWASPVVRCGQNSLQIFCEGILLSVLAHFVLTELHHGVMMQLLVTITGIAIMIGTAMLMDWYKTLDRRQKGGPPRAPVPSAPGSSASGSAASGATPGMPASP